MIPLQIAKIVIMRLRMSARYAHGETPCPVCGAASKVTSTGGRIGCAVVRYHACDACGACFKSLEQIAERAECPDVPTVKAPEKMTEPMFGRHDKGKKRRR